MVVSVSGEAVSRDSDEPAALRVNKSLRPRRFLEEGIVQHPKQSEEEKDKTDKSRVRRNKRNQTSNEEDGRSS